VLGLVAFSCAAAWWLAVLVGGVLHYLSPASDGLGKGQFVAFLMALVGSHLFALLGTAMQGKGEAWGIRAIACFWLGVLIWVPVGTIVHLLAGFFAR
jgi:hypothetical protein